MGQAQQHATEGPPGKAGPLPHLAVDREAMNDVETDVVVVGARCAGAATAMLLARRNISVVVLDRATKLGDTMSTHAITRGGVVQLDRWGLLDDVLATGTPAIKKVTFHVNSRVHAIAVKPNAGVDCLVAPRRRLLDNLILDAAAAAGAEVRLGISVGDVIRDGDGRVTGVTGQAADGTTVTVRARLVIGADGMRSRIARAVDSPIVDELVTDTGAYFTYFDGIPWDGFEFYIADRAFTGVFPTNDEAACVWVVASGDAIAALRAEHGANEVGFHQLIRRTAPDLADRLVDARVVERTRVALRYPSFVRHPVGEGWALAGDAGYYRDAITGHGITDAFRDADLLAAAVGEWFRGAQPETVALHRYAIEREAELRPIFDVTNALAAWPEPEPFFGLQKDLNRLLEIEAERLASAPPPRASTATGA
jgi:2-polyprenyl-6-methoxyphenol hydroxylase-like FAD-dependent oxidoreductase